MESRSEEKHADFYPYDELLPPELKLAVANQITHLRDFLKLFSINKQWAAIAERSSKFKFFDTGYQRHSGLKHHVLALEKMTASHFRAGNLLVGAAIEELLDGRVPEGELLLRKAMYRYGSFNAMILIEMLSGLPARIKFNFNIKLFILFYQKFAIQATQDELTPLFFEKKSDCRSICVWQTRLFYAKIRALRSAYSHVYLGNNGISPDLKHTLRSLYAKYYEEELGQAVIEFLLFQNQDEELVSKLFAEEYLGFKKITVGREADYWFLNTESHKKFLEIEAKLDEADVLQFRKPGL